MESREGDIALPEPSAEIEGCQIGANEQALLALWTDGPSSEGLELKLQSGVITATLQNTTKQPIDVSVQLILAMDTKTTINLLTEKIPAGGKLAVPIDLAVAGAQKIATNAPGQIILRVLTNPASTAPLLVWSKPVYVHYDAIEDAFVVYDAVVHKTKYNNGDLKGVLTNSGGTPGSELVLSNGV